MAEKATILLEAKTAEARAEISRLAGFLEDLEGSAVQAGDGFQRLSNDAAQDLRDLEFQVERTQQSMRSISGSASSTANSLGIELTQAAQDASFGVAGVANQIPQLQAEFTRLQDETGSTGAALSELGATFAGPTGVLAAGTLLLQFLPQLMDAFGETAESAEETSEAVEQLRNATDSLISGFEDELPSFEITDAEQVEQQVRGLEQSISAREETLSDLREALGATGAEQARLSPGAARFADLSDSDIQRLIQRNERRIQQERTLSRALSDQLDSREDEVDQAELLRNTQGVLVEQSKQSADATEREAEAMNGLAVSAKQAAENRQTLRRFQAAGGRQGRMFDPISFGRTPTVGGTMLRNTRRPGARMLQAAREAGFVSEFRSFEQVAGSFQSQSESAFSTVQLGAQAATSATNALTQSLARGESFARGLQGTFSQLLSQVGSSLLQKAITGGSALGLSGGPLAAIGLGGGLLGGVLGAFDSGGRVGTPLQIVGENGPELAAMPQGSRVVSNAETRRMIDQASRGAGQVQVQIKTEMRRLANGDLGVAVREANQRNALYNP